MLKQVALFLFLLGALSAPFSQNTITTRCVKSGTVVMEDCKCKGGGVSRACHQTVADDASGRSCTPLCEGCRCPNGYENTASQGSLPTYITPHAKPAVTPPGQSVKPSPNPNSQPASPSSPSRPPQGGMPTTAYPSLQPRTGPLIQVILPPVPYQNGTIVQYFCMTDKSINKVCPVLKLQNGDYVTPRRFPCLKSNEQRERIADKVCKTVIPYAIYRTQVFGHGYGSSYQEYIAGEEKECRTTQYSVSCWY